MLKWIAVAKLTDDGFGALLGESLTVRGHELVAGRGVAQMPRSRRL